MEQPFTNLLIAAFIIANTIFILYRPLRALPGLVYLFVCIISNILAFLNLAFILSAIFQNPHITMLDCASGFLSILLLLCTTFVLEFRDGESQTGCIVALLGYLGFIVLLLLLIKFLNLRYQTISEKSLNLVQWQDHIGFFVLSFGFEINCFFLLSANRKEVGIPIYFQIIAVVLFIVNGIYCIRLFFMLIYTDVPVYITGFPILVLLGILLFQLKKSHRDVYGKIEILFGLFSLAYSLYKIEESRLPAKDILPLLSIQWIQLLASIYIFIRGLDNLSEFKKIDKRSESFFDTLKTDLKNADYLVQLGINKKFKNPDGESFCHLAIIENSVPILSYLIKEKFPIKLKNRAKKTPLDVATSLGYNELIILLKNGQNK